MGTHRADRGRLRPRGFDKGLAAAQQRGGRFGFRVLAYCPDCWFDDATPSFVPLQPGTDIPDWNSEAFLSGWERLMAELGSRYDDDPRMGWVDVGGYGSWGEWHVSVGPGDLGRERRPRGPGGGPGVPDDARGHQRDDPALRAGRPARASAPGAAGGLPRGVRHVLHPRDEPRDAAAVEDGPVLSEWCGTSTTSTVLGAKQVRQYHVSQVSSGNLQVRYAAMIAAEQAGFEDAARSAGFRYEVRKVTVPKQRRTRRADVRGHPLGQRGVGADVRRLEGRPPGARPATVRPSRPADVGIDLRRLLPGRADLSVVGAAAEAGPAAATGWRSRSSTRRATWRR